MKYLIICFLSTAFLTNCAELKQVVNQLPHSTGPSNIDIVSGLKQALNFGIERQVIKLTQKDGFFKNDLVKILLPEELQNVVDGLRKMGFGNIADKGLKMINRAAEDAVEEAIPIFIEAVNNINFNDAKQILFGKNNAATSYLRAKTKTALYDKFKPVIEVSFSKVGANEIWNSLINTYNAIPFTNKVNPDLTDYVTNEALNSVFKMVAVEEKKIRTKTSSRTTDILKQVFALQDTK